MRLARLGLFGLVLTGLTALSPSAAGADCVGPSLSVTPTSGAPGDTVTLDGQYFGTDCLDQGDVGQPPGSGVLGEPGTDIKLYFVQNEVPTVVATVDAEADYSFSVPVTVPASAVPGVAAFGTDASVLPPTGAEFTVTGAAVRVDAAPDFTG